MKLNDTLQLADDALVMGHRMSEWCGHGPILEQDIAITNMALDHLGRARSLYQYAAEQFNNLPATEKEAIFSSAALHNIITAGKTITEDDLAYLRDAWDFKNLLLLEQPNKDWAYTVARSFYYDTFNFFFFTALQNSADPSLAAIAEKSLKEATYHMRWSSEWVIRLGDGTGESHDRMQHAINDRWAFSGELFNTMPAHAGIDMAAIKSLWQNRIRTITDEATLTLPADIWMQEGGRDGRHTEHLGYILAELQFMQRAYPAMEW